MINFKETYFYKSAIECIEKFESEHGKLLEIEKFLPYANLNSKTCGICKVNCGNKWCFVNQKKELENE